MSTAHDLQAMAHYIACYGIHTGVQMAVVDKDGITRLDISAIAYVVTDGAAENSRFPTLIPGCFLDNEDQSLTLIQSSARAMACLRAISDVLDSSVCETEIEPGTWVPDYLEHVSNWAATASPVAPKRPPTPDEVIGRILRAANRTAIRTPTARIPDHIAHRITEDSLHGPMPTWAKYEDRDADVWHLTDQTHDGDHVMLPSAGGTPLMLRRDAERLYGPLTPTA